MAPAKDVECGGARMDDPRRNPVADMVLQGGMVARGARVERAKVLRKLQVSDITYRWLTRAAAILVLVILSGIILSLIRGSWLALNNFGFTFLIDDTWNPVTEKFGAAAAIYGTVVISIIAMLIAFPVGLLIAVFLTELCPMCVRRPIGTR